MLTRGANIDRRLHVAAVLLIAGSLALPARTEQAAAPPSQEALARVDGIVERERAKAKIPGLNVAIALGGRIVYEKGFGLADVENNVPVTHETRFRTASIAKPITATAVLQLVERGAIDLDAPIQQYCPAFPQKPWPITARMILGHLAGIRHYTKRGESAGTEHFFAIADSLKLFKDDPLLHEPGTTYEYSTYGYSVLGCAVESASKMTYAEYLRRNVFEPAGMTKTTIDEHYLILPNRARGYQLLTKEGFDSLPPAAKAIARPDEVYNAVLHDTSMKTPGGGLLSTASDLVRFASAVRDGKLLKRESLQAMWTSQKTRGGEETRYGLGWGVRVTDGRLTGVFHSGNQAGASSNLRLAPADGGAIAIMTNLEDAELGPILNAIAADVRAEFQLDGRATGAIRFEPYPLKLDDGTTVEAERGRLTVPENRARPGRTIELVFVRLRSTAARAGDPIVYLAGGPGDSGTSAARVPRLGTLFQRMRAIADVILLDQRATGQSTPSLFCPADGPLAADALESAAAMRAALEPRVRACAERRRAEGVDVTAYTTEASADDLDDLRAALGAARLNLFGFSYGTHLALTAMRRHGDRLGRIVLAGTEGPDHTYKLPSVLDRQVDTVSALAARDPAVASDVPDMAGLLRQILQRLEREPVKLTMAGMRNAERTITVGAWGFLYLLRRDIGDTNDLPGFPRLLHQIARGELDALARLAERRFTQLASGTPLMPIAMDCASGVSAARAAQIAAETRSSTFGAMTNYPFPEVCDTLGLKSLGDEFRAPLVSRLPVLFISGTLDANTPPHQAEEIRRGLPLATHIIVEGAGHESTLPLPEVEHAILDFLGGKDVPGRHIRVPLTFRPVR